MLFIAFVLDAAFTLSLTGFIAMHGRMVAGYGKRKQLF